MKEKQGGKIREKKREQKKKKLNQQDKNKWDE